ncbi:hypothetical protein [Priestia flexa]|uniref:Uncharacterized protein n=1 Tax=Priestia flexa TaxID=86664 RepID=A0A8I1MGR2_9BACI|nr:hypothetical protein [Priestia flexa]MBN8252807.1 hypothetical protein [Priestia flexa]UZW66665.1 hypothetical protein OC195_01485 [Priestia flexa]
MDRITRVEKFSRQKAKERKKLIKIGGTGLAIVTTITGCSVSNALNSEQTEAKVAQVQKSVQEQSPSMNPKKVVNLPEKDMLFSYNQASEAPEQKVVHSPKPDEQVLAQEITAVSSAKEQDSVKEVTAGQEAVQSTVKVVPLSYQEQDAVQEPLPSSAEEDAHAQTRVQEVPTEELQTAVEEDIVSTEDQPIQEEEALQVENEPAPVQEVESKEEETLEEEQSSPLQEKQESLQEETVAPVQQEQSTSSVPVENNVRQEQILEVLGVVTGLVDAHCIELDVQGQAKAFHVKSDIDLQNEIRQYEPGTALVVRYVASPNGQNQIRDIVEVVSPDTGDQTVSIEADYFEMVNWNTVQVYVNNQPTTFKLSDYLAHHNEKFAPGTKVLLTGVKTSQGTMIESISPL